MLSATFGLTGDALVIDGLSQIADENLTIRENGGVYEFVLFEGNWTGTDSSGIAGNGTEVLSVDKAAVAGLSEGILVDAIGVRADVSLRSADFSEMTGGLTIRNAGAVTQAAGGTLTVGQLDIVATTISIAGTIAGGTEAVTLTSPEQIVLRAGASLTTTTGAITLSANEAGRVRGESGIVLDAAKIATSTGAITLRGHGGLVSDAKVGVSLLEGSQIISTGESAGAIQIFGSGEDVVSAHGVALSGATIRSAYGDIEIIGDARSDDGDGVRLVNQTSIESIGSGTGAAEIIITGATSAGPLTAGVSLSDSIVTSVDGAIAVTGTAVDLNARGIELFDESRVTTTGAGVISLEGTTHASGLAISLSQSSAIRSAGTPIIVTTLAGSLMAEQGVIASPDGTITISSARDAWFRTIDAGLAGSIQITAAAGRISIWESASAATLSMRAAWHISATTRVAAVEALSAAGTVSIDNSGDLTIGGVDASLAGVRGTSGVTLESDGSIFVNLAGETISTTGQVRIELRGESDLVTGGGNSERLGGTAAIEASEVIIDAGRDIIIGDAMAGAAGDIIGGVIQVVAGRDVIVDAGSVLDVDTTLKPSFWSFLVKAGGDVRYLATGGVTGASSSTAGVDIEIGAGGTFVADSGAATVLSTTRNGLTAAITVAARDMTINGGIDAGHDPLRSFVELSVFYVPEVERTLILGSEAEPTDPATRAVRLTDAELDRVTAHVLRLSAKGGDATIQIAGAITQQDSSYAELSLFSYGVIIDATPGEEADITVDSLTVQTWDYGAAVVGSAGDGDIDIAVNTIAGRVTGDIYIENWGTLTVSTGDDWLGRLPTPGPLQGITSNLGSVVLATRGQDADVIVNQPVVAGESVTIRAADSVSFSSSGGIKAGHGISMIANTDDLASDDGDVITMADEAVLDGGKGQILFSTAGAAVDTGGTGGRITLGRLVTTYGIAGETDAAVTILTDADVVDGGDSGGSDIQAIEGLLVIDAVAGIGFWSDTAADPALEADVSSLLITNRLAGDIVIDEYDGVTVSGIDQQAETGRVVLHTNTELALPSQRVYSVHTNAFGVWIKEHRSDGTYVREWELPPRGFARPGELAVDAAGRVHLIDTERSDPTIFTLDPLTGHIQDTSLPAGIGWYGTRGSIAAVGQFVFVVDPTAPADTGRLIRYNADTGEITTFSETHAGQEFSYSSVAAGLNGLIYAVSYQSVSHSYIYRVTIIDPTTLTFVKSIQLDFPVRDIAVDSHGVIFGIDDAKAYRFGRAGDVVAEMTLPSSGWGDWLDLDISRDGTTLVTSVNRLSPVSRMAFFDPGLQFVQSIDVADSERFATAFRSGTFGSLTIETAATGGSGIGARSGEVLLESRGAAGDIALGAGIRTSGSTDAEGAVSLVAGRSIQAGDAESDVTAASLSLVAEAGIGTSDGPLQVTLTNFGDAGRIDIDAGAGGAHLVSNGSLQLGDVSAGTVDLAVTGGVTIADGTILDADRFDYRGLSSSDPLVLVSNDGTEAISGTFAGIEEGAIVDLVEGHWVRLTYSGGDGNDLALVAEEIVDHWEAESPEMGHRIGRVDGNGWSARVKLDQPGFLLFGPYATMIPAGVQFATFRLLVNNTTADDAKIVRLEVFDTETRSLLAQRVLTRGEFTKPFVYQDFDLAFLNTADSRLEFRVWWYDTAYVRVDAVRVTTVPPPPLVLEAEQDFGHRVGRATAEGWIARPALDPAGFLAFGPFTTTVPAGQQAATFRLRANNLTADNVPIVTLDVRDVATGQTLARRLVRRTDFVAANVDQEFVLDFDNPSGSRLEFRVYWHDTAVVAFDRVIVTQTPTSSTLEASAFAVLEAPAPQPLLETKSLVVEDTTDRQTAHGQSADLSPDNVEWLATGLNVRDVWSADSSPAAFHLVAANATLNDEPLVTLDVFDRPWWNDRTADDPDDVSTRPSARTTEELELVFDEIGDLLLTT